MRHTRSCVDVNLATGRSGCQLDLGKIRAIIIVPHGQILQLWDNNILTNKQLVRARVHTNEPFRIFPINGIVDYAKSGGEPQVSAVGYDGNGVTGISARTDTFTLSKYSEHIAASLTKNMNKRFDVYYVDENNVMYGIQKDGQLYGFPMLTIYTNATPHPTSSAQATMTISCCLENAREAIECFDYHELKGEILDELEGLVPVDLVETATTGKYKVVETIGGYDRTAEFGAVTAQSLAGLFNGITAASYENGLLTLTAEQGVTPSIKAASVLFAAGITHIEYNTTVPKAS
ncbi:MAG: hypothetical protein J5733_02240 [Bacteroidaceae bacterium]|nr:hypothetical protein [Bacteroidaceae bacterium]